MAGIVAGKIIDVQGKTLVNASVFLFCAGREVAQAHTDAEGAYQLCVSDLDGPFDIAAVWEDLGCWKLAVDLGRGLDLCLASALSIAGAVLALDNKPQNAVILQVLSAGEIVATTQSDEGGHYRFVNLKPGPYTLRCLLPGKHLYYDEQEAGGGMVLDVVSGEELSHIDFCFAPFKKGRWQTYTALDGLPAHWVESVIEASDGALWVATSGGVARLDGLECTKIIPGKTWQEVDCRGLCEAVDGAMWIATMGGAFRVGGKSLQQFTQADGLVANAVLYIYQTRDGVLWFATEGGASRYDGAVFTNYTTADGLVHDEVREIFEAADGNLWFATAGGISRFDGAQFRNYTVEDGLVHNAVRAIVQAEDGGLFFGTGGGLAHFDGAQFKKYTTRDGLVHDWVFALCLDRDGDLWMGTYGGGVSRFAGLNFTTLNEADGLAHNRVGSICQLRDGALCFGTLSGGVSVYRPDDIRAFGKGDGMLSERVVGLALDTRGRPWVGTGAGALCYEDEQFVAVGRAEGLAEYQVGDLHCDDRSVVWMAAERGGVWHYDGERTERYTVDDGLVHDQVWGVYRTRAGALFFSTAGGLSHFDGESFHNYTTADGLGDDHTRDVCEDAHGDIWAASYRRGVARLDGARWTPYTKADGLASDVCLSVYCAQDGALWVATTQGLSCLREEKLGVWDIKNYGEAEGMPHLICEAVRETSDGLLWVATNGGGVVLWDGENWSMLDVRDGLPHLNVYALEIGSDDSIWLGTGAGLARYRRNAARPAVQITGMRTDRLFAPDELPPVVVGMRVTIEYNAIDLKTVPAKRQYRCRVLPRDVHWGRATKSAAFEWVPEEPGAYRFEVQAIDRDLNYSAAAALEVHVVPLPHEEALAQARMELEVAYRELAVNNELLERARAAAEKARIAAEEASLAKSQFLANMSHEIRTPMNAILGYAQILQDDGRLHDDQYKALNTIEKSGDHLLALINDVLDIAKIEAGGIELNRADFDLSELVAGLAGMFSLRCRQKHLAWGIDALGESAWVCGDQNKLRQVLINLLGNAVKFTDAGEVSLSVTRSGEDRYAFKILDTGPGITPSEQEAIFAPFAQGKESHKKGGTGLGLAIARQHVELMGGQLMLESAPGQGAEFSFALVLPSGHAHAPHMQTGRIVSLARDTCVQALVVDDVAENRAVLGQMLRAVGIEVFEAEGGVVALECVRETRPDVVFMDIRMPQIGGVDTMRRIDAELGREQMKMIAISASVLQHERQAYLDAGFDAFVPKPFRREEVLYLLQQLLAIEWIYEQAAGASEWVSAEALPAIRLPAPLLIQLKEAAELYSVTELEAHLNEVEKLDAAHAEWVSQVRVLNQRYDMEAVMRLLVEVKVGPI